MSGERKPLTAVVVLYFRECFRERLPRNASAKGFRKIVRKQTLTTDLKHFRKHCSQRFRQTLPQNSSAKTFRKNLPRKRCRIRRFKLKGLFFSAQVNLKCAQVPYTFTQVPYTFTQEPRAQEPKRQKPTTLNQTLSPKASP